MSFFSEKYIANHKEINPPIKQTIWTEIVCQKFLDDDVIGTINPVDIHATAKFVKKSAYTLAAFLLMPLKM